jgi:hypothetical protein
MPNAKGKKREKMQPSGHSHQRQKEGNAQLPEQKLPGQLLVL